uniref:polynucleotide adenylyltransferase n=1 Tax=Meloidogyne floridensis TaxID=298350 RepID=A0A915PD76_9BILA
MFDENEVTAEQNRMAASIFVFHKWIKLRVEVKKDLPKYWENLLKSEETKFWLNDLYEHVFILEDLNHFGDDKALKVLAGVKALADGEIKIEDLFKELINHLDMMGLDEHEKLDKLWRKKHNKRIFVTWIKKLLKDELFKEIEIIKNVDRKGKKIKDSNNTYMEEQVKEINYFLDRLKEDLLSNKIDFDKFASAFNLEENNIKDIFKVLKIKIKPNELRLEIKKRNQHNQQNEKNKINQEENKEDAELKNKEISVESNKSNENLKDKNNEKMNSSKEIKEENINSKNKKKSKKKKGVKNEGVVEEIKKDKNIVNIEGEEMGNKNEANNKDEDNKVIIKNHQEKKDERNKEENNDKEEKIKLDKEERKKNVEVGRRIEGNNEGNKKEGDERMRDRNNEINRDEKEEGEKKIELNKEERKRNVEEEIRTEGSNEENKKEEKEDEKNIELNKEGKKNDQGKEGRTHGINEEKKGAKNEEKVEVNNQVNSVKNNVKDKKNRRKNKSRKTKSNNLKKIEVKDKELLINAEDETKENKETSDSRYQEEDYCLFPDSEDDSLGFTNSSIKIIENSLPNIQTELLDDKNNELNLNKKEESIISLNNKSEEFNKLKSEWENIKNNKFNNSDCNLFKAKLEKYKNKKLKVKLENERKLLIEAVLQLIPTINNKVYPLEETISYFKSIIYGWHPESLILISGSYIFKALTPESDIDIIILLPNYEKINEINLQYTNNLVFNEDENSLYNIIRRMEGVSSLFKVGGRVPLLKLKYYGYDFDLLFVGVPFLQTNENSLFLEKKYKENLNLEDTDKLINQIIFYLQTKPIEDIRSVILPLSGYRANLYITKLMEENFENFRTLLFVLKIWAKKHFIYSGQFGFFNGTNLSVMACKTILLNKNRNQSIVHLLEQFYITFTEWLDKRDWTNPVLLESLFDHQQLALQSNNPLDQNYQDFISIKNSLNWDINSDYNKRRQVFGQDNYTIYDQNKHRLMQHAKMMWPIIAPGNPPQNSGFNINYSTSRILLSEMRLELIHSPINQAFPSLKYVQSVLKYYQSKIKKSRKDKIIIKNTWINWLDGGPFEEKYEHFMAITSINSNPNNSNNQIFEEFNNFVETRIRLGLVFNIENIPEIDYCHAKPGRVWNNEKCPSIIIKDR